ncbi:MAG: DUF4349 domain-containing protein, partial [Acidobacteria bacterium]|nr:DUF4349 domain-containing protein [Acidobacteriota bacterium]
MDTLKIIHLGRRNGCQIAVLALAAWCTLYIMILTPLRQQRSIAAQRASGLGAVGYEPLSLWRQGYGLNQGIAPVATRHRNWIVASQTAGWTSEGKAIREQALDDSNRYVTRSAALELEVKSPAETAEKIRALAERVGGYLVSSEVGDDRYTSGGTISVRVPAGRYEEARAELKKLALRVENDRVEANDVTKDYVDREARLRNLQAEELQFLAILKRAASVK